MGLMGPFPQSLEYSQGYRIGGSGPSICKGFCARFHQGHFQRNFFSPASKITPDLEGYFLALCDVRKKSLYATIHRACRVFFVHRWVRVSCADGTCTRKEKAALGCLGWRAIVMSPHSVGSCSRSPASLLAAFPRGFPLLHQIPL
jgi:hypothetical protein